MIFIIYIYNTLYIFTYIFCYNILHTFLAYSLSLSHINYIFLIYNIRIKPYTLQSHAFALLRITQRVVVNHYV